jgi:hypothetical protein
MSRTQTATEKEEKKVKPQVDLCPRWTLERECYATALIRDMKTHKMVQWPYQSSDIVAENTYNMFLEKVTDPDTGYFYPKRDSEGKAVKTTPDNIPKYVVRTIIRIKRKDKSEYLLSKGSFIGYDSLGDEVSHYVPYPERWTQVNFIYAKDWDPKRKSIVKNCMGPGQNEEIYTLEFNEKNLKSLFDNRINDYIDFVVKEEQSSTPKHVAREPNINDTFKLFLKPFDYLYNATYISAEMKAQYRQEAIDQGLLSAPSSTTTTGATSTRSPPSTGTYS